MKTFTLELTVNGLSKAPEDLGSPRHSASLFGHSRAERRDPAHNVTIDGLPTEMAAAFGGAYGKARGVRITIEVSEPGEEPAK